jgi:hypothetical protein
MPVFVVVVKRGANTVQERIAELPKKSVRALTDDAWLIDYDGTTKECAESMGIRGEESDASGIAFAVSNYSGRFSTDAWEWLRLHMTRGDI